MAEAISCQTAKTLNAEHADEQQHRNINSDADHHNNDGDENVTLMRIDGIQFVDYIDESQIDHVMSLVGRDLSEPYSIFTYRYFLHRFPQLCILAVDVATNEAIGCVVGKIDEEEEEEIVPVSQQQQFDTGNESAPQDRTHHAKPSQPTTTTTTKVINNVGYIGMLAVSEQYRRRGIGKALVQRILHRMRNDTTFQCTSVALETEVTNVTAQLLYQNYFGFIREELLVRYYLNWNDAYRLRLWFENET